MSYSDNHPVRLAGGRLALDLLNTADWSAAGDVVHEKIVEMADLNIWLEVLSLNDVGRPKGIQEFHKFRGSLRQLFIGEEVSPKNTVVEHASELRLGVPLENQPLLTLVSISALSILADPREHQRIKMCPGIECGWLFIDETRNGRRRWCLMETCGNRAKAARHYKKTSKPAHQGE